MAQAQKDEFIGQVAFSYYELEEFVGSGGFGRVYRAVHPVARKVYAVKVFPQGLAGDAGFKARFEREVAVWGRLKHPNIVEFVNAGMEESVGPAIAMEYVDGRSLEKRIGESQGKPLPINEAVNIAIQLLAALDYVHGQNDVHSDVHPGNVLLAKGGTVKLADFGLTRMVHEGSGMYSPYFTSRPSMGLTAFASPEADRGLTLTPQSDIYQAGQVLSCMLGRAPRSTKAIDEANPGVVRDLKAIIQKATEERPDGRYRSAAEFAEALKVFMSPPQYRQYPAEIMQLLGRSAGDVLDPDSIGRVRKLRKELEGIVAGRGLPFDFAQLDAAIGARREADAGILAGYAVETDKGDAKSMPPRERARIYSQLERYLAVTGAWGVGDKIVRH